MSYCLEYTLADFDDLVFSIFGEKQKLSEMRVGAE
jgi:hypothetical protein